MHCVNWSCCQLAPSVRPIVRPSIRPTVRPSVRPSIHPSVRPSDRRRPEKKVVGNQISLSFNIRTKTSAKNQYQWWGWYLTRISEVNKSVRQIPKFGNSIKFGYPLRKSLVWKCEFRKIRTDQLFLTLPKCFSVTWQYENTKYQVWRRSGARVWKKSCAKFWEIVFFGYSLRKSLVLLWEY